MKMINDYAKYNGEGTELRKAQIRLLEILVEVDKIFKNHDITYFLSGGTCLGAVRHGGFIPWDDDVDIDVMKKDYKKIKQILKNELPDKYALQIPKSDKGYYQMYIRVVDKNSYIEYAENKNRDQLEYKGLFLDIFPIERILSYRVKKFIDSYYVRIFRVKRNIGGSTIKRIIAYFAWPLIKSIVITLRVCSIFSNHEKFSHSYGTNIAPRLKLSNLFPTKPICFEGLFFLGPGKPHNYLKDLYGEYMNIPPQAKRHVHGVKIKVY